MRDTLAKSLGRELDYLASRISEAWAWTSPEINFARFVFHSTQMPLPVTPVDPAPDFAQINRFDQAPVLAAIGYELAINEDAGEKLRNAWAEGFARLASRNPFPADRASFFYRPVELLGVAVGVAHCPQVSESDARWLREVMVTGESKFAGDDTRGFYLGAYAAHVVAHEWRSKPKKQMESPSAFAIEELAVLKWLCVADRAFSEGQELTLRERDISAALLEKALLRPEDMQDAARAAVLYVSLKRSINEVLASSVEQTWQVGRDAVDSVSLVSMLCRRFPLYARQLTVRHNNRETVAVKDEYDVQDLMHAMLNLHFDDVRPEEWTPSYAGSASRTDFLLKREQIVIEAKMTRKNLDQKEVANQLMIDKGRYRAHPDCETLLCFVYDPEGKCHNPTALEDDLSEQEGELRVIVIVAPKGV